MDEPLYYDLKGATTMTPSMAVQVARDLGRKIVGGGYEPGSLIDDETALADLYQVSRVVVREAVKILVGKGLIDVRRGIGTRVRQRNQWVLLDDDVLAWHLSAPPAPGLLNHLMEIRVAIEPKAARWAAERATEEDLEEIEAALISMDADKGDVEKFIIADAKFHRSVLHAAHNEFLSAMEGVIYSALLTSIRITNPSPEENDTSIPFHRDLYKAIAAKNAARAEKLSEKLLNDAGERLSNCKD